VKDRVRVMNEKKMRKQDYKIRKRVDEKNRRDKKRKKKVEKDKISE